jgi:hypothetical protein
METGIISFGQFFDNFIPELFPVKHNDLFPVEDAVSLVAPFWSDGYTSPKMGGVFYHIYSDTESPVMIQASDDLTKFTGGFNATWLMVVTWDKVLDYLSPSYQVQSAFHILSTWTVLFIQFFVVSIA